MVRASRIAEPAVHDRFSFKFNQLISSKSMQKSCISDQISPKNTQRRTPYIICHGLHLGTDSYHHPKKGTTNDRTAMRKTRSHFAYFLYTEYSRLNTL